MRPVCIQRPGIPSLRGILHMPSDSVSARPKLAVILLPGLAGNRVGPHRILFDLACELCRNNLPVLRCDLSNSGYSDRCDTELPFEHYVGDVKRMMDFLQSEIGVERFLIGGICRGAKVALAASLEDDRICHLVLLSCARLREVSTGLKIARRKHHHVKTYIGKFLSFRWFPRLIAGDLNLRLIAQTLNQPVKPRVLAQLDAQTDAVFSRKSIPSYLFVYGENDPDASDAMAYYTSLLGPPNKEVRFEVIPRADAGFYAADWHKGILRHVTQWWNEQKKDPTYDRS